MCEPCGLEGEFPHHIPVMLVLVQVLATKHSSLVVETITMKGREGAEEEVREER